MRINSIYLATEGEGIFLGTVQIFVRFNGCDIGCDNCDSSYTWSFNGGVEMTQEEVLQEIYRIGHQGSIKRVSITGGDPLNEKNVAHAIGLAKALKNQNYFINVEASGNIISKELFDLVDFISMDYKTPSSGVTTDLSVIKEMLKNYSGKFQIKSVVENGKDFDFIYQAYDQMKGENHFNKISWVITPSYNTNETFPRERFQNILGWNETRGGYFRVVGQQHKWVYGPKKTNV